eukprot:CAMPEP_0202427514 /NCGR_PEP_ID=MMETSP1345-20130828/1717_1 /ASSEMBLY_ACC=CAM_ASM_000843 /TAXON_ID=342563 /ORGANISM="Fabrea Fabrea salina" /LENGTH=261 /DNA_ID=CAMNT_0049038247 /DNA_START=518 /DNA_END=1304 /DNA_ORIENTATION=+
MGNKLTGETLRGLYENSSNLKGGLKVLENQLSNMLEGSVSMTQFENNAHSEFQELQKFKSETVLKNCETADYRINVQNEVKSIRLQSREKLDHLKKSLQKAVQESLKLSQKCEEVDHKKETAQLRNDQVRNQIQVLQDKNKNKEFEKFCLNCGKHYFEEGNFNWSCVRHFTALKTAFIGAVAKPKKQQKGASKANTQAKKNKKKSKLAKFAEAANKQATLHTTVLKTPTELTLNCPDQLQKHFPKSTGTTRFLLILLSCPE